MGIGTLVTVTLHVSPNGLMFNVRSEVGSTDYSLVRKLQEKQSVNIREFKLLLTLQHLQSNFRTNHMAIIKAIASCDGPVTLIPSIAQLVNHSDHTSVGIYLA